MQVQGKLQQQYEKLEFALEKNKITWWMQLFVHPAVADFIDNNITSYLVPLHNRGHPVCKSIEKFLRWNITSAHDLLRDWLYTNAVYLFSYLNVIGKHRTKAEFPWEYHMTYTGKKNIRIKANYANASM